MLLKICILGLGLAMLATYHPAAAAAAEPLTPAASENQVAGAETVGVSVPFETSHKHPEAAVHSEEGFHTAHRISVRATADPADYSMNLLPTKERPELNPVLSALINEDVMKSIEAKRAIEEEELAEVRREIEEAALAELAQRATEAPAPQLTTQPSATKKIDNLDDDVVVDPHDDFVNQNFPLEGAGSENSKKSRIEIKKGPNGQDYEYEYVYYYEEDDDAAAPAKPAVVESAGDPDTRGKTRYTNIERSTPASPSENSLQSGKAKGRSSSSVSDRDPAEDIELERLPVNTRFPSRGKNIEVPPTPALDSLETAAERKKISVKRPSLELVDSETFNTDEKQQKGSRNGDNELKPVIAVEQEQAAAAAAAAKERELKKQEEQKKQQQKEEQQDLDPEGITDEAEQTTPSMEKAALDLYAILTNENLNNEQTTSADGALDDANVTTLSPDTASTDEDDGSLTTLQDELSSTSSTTTTTTTTTTEAPTTTTTTTTTTTVTPSLFGGRRSGLNGLAGRNRFKLRDGGAGASAGATSTTSTTEAPATEATKTGRNRFSRPSIGGRSRPGARTTASPESNPAPAPGAEEEVVAAKEVKPVSSGFARGRPRNRFNLRGSTTSSTTERSAEEASDGSASPDAVPSTTARSTLRGRPGLGLRGRSRSTTTKAPAGEGSGSPADDSPTSEEGKAAAAPAAAPAESVRPSRFNLHRAGGNRLLPRGKLGRAGVSTEAPKADAPEDSAADSTSHHNDVKGAVEATEGAEKTEGGDAAGAGATAGPVSGFNRLKNRPRLNALHKTDAAKPKTAAGAGAASSPAAVAPRKINPLLAKRRLHLGGAAAAAATSTTEVPAEEEHSSSDGASGEQAAKEEATAGSEEAGSDSAAKDQDTTEAAETTTKQQARGLGLLGQRRRLPLRKPGTIL
ncbi:uncharacterized protein LOC6598342 [Drosophila persimilis]|uniref:uncharacterized protein LOC6598342 n=1 Tax=Drosophila persimilis TaxID=7234 RepID=UPI000F07BF32|nr:uncharacterized protein LOC6598342 [Drosophila persimilis]